MFHSRRGNPFPFVLTVFDDAFNCKDGSVVSRRNILGLEGTHRNLEELVDNVVKLFGSWANVIWNLGFRRNEVVGNYSCKIRSC